MDAVLSTASTPIDPYRSETKTTSTTISNIPHPPITTVMTDYLAETMRYSMNTTCR
uniref:Uncharacterized protein n=1 Tax=Parascaris univalens TaxID=6257 RepID=A0A915AXJ8_PARUN